tara:strand:- start:365 stop:3499 length:3135 start_codon:yes stop_codon:yes gene_type:complete
MNTLFRYVSLVLSVTLISFITYSDVDTTSALRGSVNVSGATIEAEYTPTGLTKTTVSGSSGNYSLSFLPIGGPYRIKVTAPGYESESVSGVYLSLSDDANINVVLSRTGSVDEIVVTAQASEEAFRIGSGTLLTREEMNAVPTVNRSIADFAKLDPRVSINSASSRNTQISVMGANNRFNDFSIDGVSFNDPFGLNANGFGTMRNPISIDFIEQISIDITPFDVARGNTTGGSIAAVTKSGTNEFHGSVYFSQRDESNIGDDQDGIGYPTFEEETTSATFSGPLIKDRLFFFVGYEEFEKSLPVLYGTKDSTAQNKAEVVTSAIADQISAIAKNTYGYDTGNINNVSFPETSEEYTIKIDAIINDANRAVLNYSYNESVLPRKYNRGATVFSNNYYSKPPEIERLSLVLYSDLTDRLTSKLKFSSYEMNEDDASLGDPYFPEVNISVTDGAGGEDNVYLGGDRYRGANLISVDTDLVTFKLDYDADDHLYTMGVEREESSVYNLFIARYNGEIQFDSIADFQTGNWSYLRFHTPLAGNDRVETAAAAFDVEKDTFYIQDKYYASDDLTLIFGVRYDKVMTPTVPTLNPNFLKRNGVANNANFNYNKMQPRFSFKYDATDMFGSNVTSAKFRGGRGLFLGRIPNVWYGNAYSRSGGLTDYNRFRSFDSGIGVMPAASVATPNFFWLGATSDYEVRSAYFGDAQGTDPDFEAPSSWRSNLALDLVLDSGYDITIEYNRDSVDTGVFYRDLGLKQSGQMADGRGLYDGAGDFWLTNDDQGGATAYTFTVGKSFGDVKLYAAYTNMETTDVYPLTSTQAESSYGYTQRYDGENLDAARSSFMVEHKFLATLDYTTQLIGENDTRFSLVFVRKSGEPYSVTYDESGYDAYNHQGGQFYADYSLVYVPTGASDPKVSFKDAAAATAVMNHVNNTGLSQYKGGIAPRNAFTSPYYSRLDLRITQDFKVMDGHKVTVYLDMLNLLNYIDDKKGLVKEYSFNNSRQILTSGVTSDTDQPKYILTGVDADDSLFIQNGDGQSAWQMNLGFRYQF